ncbi:gamma-glutamylputrescine oxidase [Tistlia consotensis]|uniref:Gamma-glutamylputrescine oxidase n=1 Tax=Tistlia consotensis USBA 355 TaxID=560819 RepID=A0A1Y6BMU5_9PROT|nr:FAD-binding oxidoreductase [Tistlia consotensis]SMF15917.1 gamma-glutamylputrescine oxidase [Tistlia consotensis USBA 355]SNR41601.1 gamma-glutamylputrescine oxidase [Tistlia consotensis]
MPREPHVESYYAATANPAPERPPLAGEVSCDVCIVGGGFTGLSAALELAERGYAVVLLEARRIGWGASGRNGGQVCSAFSSSMDKVAAWVGRDDARKLFDLTEESKRLLAERIGKHGIDCDLTWGYFNSADRPRELDDCREWQEEWSRDYGYDKLTLVETPEAARAHVDSPTVIGGLADAGAGHLHPLNYCLGLAEAAAAAGAALHEGSAVTRIVRGASPVVETAQGKVRATFVVVACNAYLGNLLPEARRKIMPVGTYIGATEPLGEERARSLIPKNEAICDLKFVLNYYRLSKDQRMLFGGRVSYSGITAPNLPQAMGRKMRQVFPQLSDVRFEFTWGGFVAITMERSPHFGRVGTNVFFAQGYSGNGVAMSAIAGRVLAEAIGGQAERFDVFARLPHTTFPGGKLLRTPTLALAMLWFRLKDLRP